MVMRALGPLSIGVVAIALCLTIAAAVVPRPTLLGGWLTDLAAASRVAVFGPQAETGHVLVAALDRKSLDHPRLLTVPRALFTPVHAELIDKAMAHGARAVVIDLILAYDAAGLSVQGTRPLVQYDTAFLRLLRKPGMRGRIFLGRSGTVLPARRFRQVAGEAALGMVEVPLDPGGVVRHVPLTFRDAAGNDQATLTGRVMSALDAQPGPRIELVPPFPLDTLPAASVIDMLECDDPKRLSGLFKGRVVFIGSVLEGEDRLTGADRLMPRVNSMPIESAAPCDFARPVVRKSIAGALPGVYLHAGATDAVLGDWAPDPAPEAAHLVLVFLLAVSGGMAASRRRPVFGTLQMAGAMAGGFALIVVALHAGVLIPAAAPLLAAPACFGLTWGLRIGLIDRKDRQVRQAFGRYLSPVIVDRMIQTGSAPALGGEDREVTVMFADLSGFTAASETMASDELTRVLNRYLDLINNVVRAEGGYVDKFIGDAVMAMWNAPIAHDDHAGAATRAALTIRDVVARESARDRLRNLPGFSIKIGVNTGPATVGNVGARDRMDFTVIGETVNLAARLESLPGLFNTPVIIGPETAERVGRHWLLLPLARIQVKGKSQGVRIFAPLARRADAGTVLHEGISDYANALDLFEAGDFQGSISGWRSLAERDWPGAGAAGAMVGEAVRLVASPPSDWDGVLAARGK